MSVLCHWLASAFSSPLGIVAQIIGFIPLVLSFFTFLSNNRRRVIGTKIATDLLWAIHFFLLGEVVGGAINALNTARNVVFSQKHRPWASRIYIPITFGALTVLAALLRWQDWYSILPMLGSLLALIGFWCSGTKHIRAFNLPAVSLWLLYGILAGSISTILCNILSIASIVTATVKSRKRGESDT